MKKIIVIIVLLILMAMAWFVFSPGPNIPSDTDTGEPKATTTDEGLKPEAITVAIYDALAEPSAYTLLLNDRLEQENFKTIIIDTLVDQAAAERDNTTLLFRTDTEGAMRLVASKLLLTTVYGQGRNEAIEQEVVISSWNIEDIIWGDLKDQADALANPNPADITLNVINAGASTGSAGDLVTVLKEAGYALAAAADAETAATKTAVIYYRRHMKAPAKTLWSFLRQKGYKNVNYRLDLAQEPMLTVVLGPADSAN